MNWYKRQLKIAMPGRGGATVKSDKWEEVEVNKEEIQNMLNQGYSKKQIAELFEVGPQLMVKMLNRFNIYRSKEGTREIAKKMMENGEALTNVAKKLRLDQKTLRDLLGIEVRKRSPAKPNPISTEEGKKIEKMHVEEGLRPTDISKILGRSATSIVDYLKRRNLYERLRGDWVRFNPTEEQIKQIDYWYALPPDGEGRSLEWIGKKFGLSGNQMGYWFKKTGRPVRSSEEQVGTESTREDISLAKLIDWEEKGGLKGILTDFYPTREQSVQYLNNYVHRLLKQGVSSNKAFRIRAYYMDIINNHTYPNEVQQQESIQQLQR